MQGKIIFNSNIELKIDFVESDFVYSWLQMVNNRPKDSLKFENNDLDNIEYFNSLRKICDDLMGWNWSSLPITQKNLNLMHQDLERLNVNQTAVPGFGHPVHELHRVLHIIEQSEQSLSLMAFRFKSYHHDKIPITDTSIRQQRYSTGSVILDYPYVGRTPINSMEKEVDPEVLSMTCIPVLDACAGFWVATRSQVIHNYTLEKLSNWCDTVGKVISEKYGKQNVLTSALPAVVGYVNNPLDIQLVARSKIHSYEIDFVG
jgi:hypothetical protein